LVGAAILAYALLVVIMKADLPFTGLLVYAGIATLLTAVGASACPGRRGSERDRREWANTGQSRTWTEVPTICLDHNRSPDLENGN
jgi:hypothetical protein